MRMTLAAAAALLAAAAIGCGGDDDAGGGPSASGPPAEPVTIRMGWGIPAEEIKYVMMKHPQVAPKLGRWYDVDWQEFIEERRPYNSTAWMVRKDSGIASLDDLKGKTVATNAVGGSADYLQDFYIEQQTGLKPDRDYKKVEVPFGRMQETLLAGRIDRRS